MFNACEYYIQTTYPVTTRRSPSAEPQLADAGPTLIRRWAKIVR